MRGPSPLREVAPALEVVLEVVVWVGGAGAVVLAVGLLIGWLRSRRDRDEGPGRVWRRRARRQAGAFGTAVAGGDFARADREAERVLRINDGGVTAPPGPSTPAWPRVHRLRGTSSRVSGRSGTGADAGPVPPDRRLALFDAHTVLACNVTDFTRVVDGPASLAKWFGVDRDADAHTLTITAGRRHLRFGDVIETWQPTARALMTTARGPSGAPIRGHVTIREAVVPHVSGPRRGVEVWVRVELPGDKGGKRLVAALGPAVEAGLRRLEAEFDTP